MKNIIKYAEERGMATGVATTVQFSHATPAGFAAHNQLRDNQEEIGDANWEGLCWLEPGRTLVLVHESRGELPAHAFILELPPDWRF